MVHKIPYLLIFQEEMKEKAKVEEEKKDEEKEDPKGIPEFWLTVFKNVDLLSDMLQVGGQHVGEGVEDCQQEKRGEQQRKVGQQTAAAP